MSGDQQLIDVALGKNPRRPAASGTSAHSATTPQRSSPGHSVRNPARTRWAVGLLLLSLFYLLFEMIFNASLVQVAGSGQASEDELTRIELLGRSLSGIGASLLLAGWALQSSALTSRLRRWTTAGVIFVLVWPLVFFGQRAVIDHYLIEPSTAEQRQRAYYAQMVRQGLANNSIDIEGIAHNPDASYSGEALTFIALFGALLYADDELIPKVETHTQAMVKKMVTDAAYRDFPDHYGRYQAFRAELQDDYRRYAKASNTFNSQKSASRQEADKAWQQVEQEIRSGWQEYQQGLAQFDREVTTKAEQLTSQLKTYFDRIGQCKSDACRKPYNDRYAKDITRLGAGYIEPNYWLLEEKVSSGEKVATTLLAGVLTGGVSLALQGINLATGGDGGIESSRFYFLNDSRDTAARLSRKLQPQFSAKAKGYAYNLADFATFRNDPLTARQVIQSSRKKGIPLPDTWTLADRTTFDRLVARKIDNEAKSAWQQQGRKQGLSLPPDLSWEQFQLHPHIQQKIRREMGDALYVKPMRADWNNRQFLQRVVEPNINRKVKEVISQLKHDVREYDDGGGMADTAKSALRAILVPPISMGLSLLLIVMTLCHLPLRLWRLLTSLLAARRKVTTPHRRVVRKLLLALLPPVLVFAVPLLFFSSSYLSSDKDTAQPQVVQYFMDQVSRQASPLASLSLRWVMSAQPLFQPLGNALHERTQLVDRFAPASEVLQRLDNHFFSIQYHPL